LNHIPDQFEEQEPVRVRSSFVATNKFRTGSRHLDLNAQDGGFRLRNRFAARTDNGVIMVMGILGSTGRNSEEEEQN
jgi:hypothetical protein